MAVKNGSDKVEDDLIISLPELIKMGYNPVWSYQFFYTIYCIIVPICSFVLLARFWWLSRKGGIQLSTQLKIHLIVWLISLVFGLSFFVPQLQDFVPPEIYNRTTDLDFELVRGALHIASTSTIPISTLFILLDRIQAISLFSMIKWWKYRAPLISIIVMSIVFSGNLTVLVYRTVINPNNSSLTCTFSCRMNDVIKDLLLVKLCASMLNILCGCYFIYLYIRFVKKLASLKQEKKINYTALLVFATELCCTIIPTGAYLSGLFPFFAGVRISALVTVGHDADGFLTSLVYWYTRSKQNAITKVSAASRKSNSHSVFKTTKTAATAVS